MSEKNLLIVESPTKAKTINQYLGKDFIVKATLGHIKDLPKTKLGVDIDNNFEAQYHVLKGKGKIIRELKKLAKKADKIFLAPDPDREGEAIAYHIYEELSKVAKKKDNIKRAIFTEITKEGIKKAIKNPGEIDLNKVEAQKARRILDRLVGYLISPILWKSVRSGLSAGRVQSVAVRLICERENEIRNFKPQEYWNITGVFKTSNEEIFKAKLFKINGKEPDIKNEKEAEKIKSEIEKLSYKITKVTRKIRRRNPPAPFITSTLQQEAAKRLKFSAKKTMQIAQQLYEGININKDGMVGLITYMRTDSTRIADSAVRAVRNFIKEKYGENYLPSKPRIYSAKKTAQDAHEAIRPTYPDRYTPEYVAKYLTKDQLALYTLIFNRFVACQMKPAEYYQTVIDIEKDKYHFRATGSILKFDGYLKVWKSIEEDSELEEKENENILPDVKENEPVELTEVKKTQHFTKPPARYTEASLIKTLEELGIGRPSTYATIVSTIQERKYVKKEKNAFVPLPLGSLINRLLIKYFPDILDVRFTAKMENELDKIESGKKDRNKLLKKFYEIFEKQLREAQKSLKQSLLTDIKCEKCGANMVIRIGKGEDHYFLGCSNYPKCDNLKEIEILPDGSIEISEKKEKEKEYTGEICEKCGRPMVLKYGPYGKFLACSGYPECKNIKPLKKNVKEYIPICKKCGKEMNLFVSENNNYYYICEKCNIGFPAYAKNMYLYEKGKIKCKKCGANMIIRIKKKNGSRFLGCENFPKCKNIMEFDTLIKCSEEGTFIEKKIKRGIIYKCSSNNKTLSIGEVPVGKVCPECKNEYLIEFYETTSGKVKIKCDVCNFSKDVNIEKVEK